MYDVGSIELEPHIVFSSRKHFREAAQEGSIPSSVYAELSGRQRRGHKDVHYPDSL